MRIHPTEHPDLPRDQLAQFSHIGPRLAHYQDDPAFDSLPDFLLALLDKHAFHGEWNYTLYPACTLNDNVVICQPLVS